MDFLANTEEKLQEMLDVIGVKDVFEDIPKGLRLDAPRVDDGMSEYEGLALMESLAAKNTFPAYDSYLGGGAYEHHIPSIVSSLCQRGEFLTAYTSYQPEISQGMLQALFEYQSVICSLTEMDVSNASVYDGASACAEGILMALRHNKKRKKIMVAGSLHPHYRGVVDQYLANQDVEIITLPFAEDGSLDFDGVDDTVAAVLLASPNFFGVVEDVKEVFAQAKEVGAISILCSNPLSYGIFASAGELGADIAVGDTQPFGLPLSFGGPYVGYLACRKKLMRQMPGRIIGETVDAEGLRGYLITLQAREQHIRREKATSNICTNQALMALASLIAILWYGKEGIARLAKTNYQRAAYLRTQMNNVMNENVFNEFVVKMPKGAEGVFKKHNIAPGINLGRFFSGMKDSWLVAVTETKSKEQLDRYLEVLCKI
jgi:glycine dehydrogenase subunit 1